MIKVNELVKTYDNGESKMFALNKVSLEIESSEFVVILGASGSGKTTLLNAISGLAVNIDGNEALDYVQRHTCI